jgi:hypothetical protein
MVAVVPEPPLLVPELAGSAADETAALRDACLAAAEQLADAARRWIAVGADPGGRRTVDPRTRGSFLGFGVDLEVGLAPDAHGPADPRMALPLLIAGWLAAGRGVTVRGELVPPDLPTGACLELGAALAAGASAAPEPVGLLVVGDGSARHSEKAPGALDDRAAPFDDAVAAALATADAAALAALDPALAADLMVAGRAPWQVLAGAAGEQRRQAELLHSSAPFGVAYHVAVWRR